jgi:hypothetical protein
MACIARESGGDGKGSTLLLLAALGLMLSSLARLPYPLPEHASDLLDDLEAAAGLIGPPRAQAGWRTSAAHNVSREPRTTGLW